MQREIKFRGMDANGIMRYGRLSQDKENLTIYYKEYSQRICWGDSNIPVSNETLGQYTGLKDKNGKEIYSDDIVKTNTGSIKVVEYVTTLNMARYLPSHLEYSEVIGNIHETPELLKGKE